MLTRKIAVNVVREVDRLTEITIHAECFLDMDETLSGKKELSNSIQYAIEQINLRDKQEKAIARPEIVKESTSQKDQLLERLRETALIWLRKNEPKLGWRYDYGQQSYDIDRVTCLNLLETLTELEKCRN